MSFLKRVIVAIVVALAGFSGGVKSLAVSTAQAAATESKGKGDSGGTAGGGAYSPTQSSGIQN